MNDIYKAIEFENQKQSRYLKLQDGEVKKLEFSADPDKIKIVVNDFNGNKTKRVEYKVIDPDSDDGEGEKILSMALGNAWRISKLMERGKNILEIERIGSGKRTQYNISPAA
jgi:hypothetical protein